MNDKHIVFKGEVQLKGWEIKHNTGTGLAFWCADEADIEKLKDMTARKGKQSGQRMMMVLVEIGDDELPVEQPTEAPAVEALPDVKGGSLAKTAGMLLNNTEFHNFIHPAGDANAYILRRCGVSRKREIDHSQMARTAFMRMMAEFREWSN